MYLLTYRHVDERFDPINEIVRWQFDEIFHHNLDFVYVMYYVILNLGVEFCFLFSNVIWRFFHCPTYLVNMQKISSGWPSWTTGNRWNRYLERTFMNFNFFFSRFISFYFDSEASAGCLRWLAQPDLTEFFSVLTFERKVSQPGVR